MEFKTVIKIVSWFNPKKHLKNYINTIIDERVKLIITSEKLDNIAHQLTKEDIEYIEHLSKNKIVQINFTSESFNKLKRLGIINETLDYKRSNDVFEKMINIRPLESVISLTNDCHKILTIINDVKNNKLEDNLKNAHDLSQTQNTLINKFSQI
ncbi:MAG: hypothetical protein K2P99_04285 [Burkholderiales bacterium]|nr:hypothetical protein [Burkholderiales bacterium]